MRTPRLLSLLLVLAALLLAAGTGAFLFRNALAGGVIRWQLAARGLDAELRVAELGLRHIELREIAAGEQRIAMIRADYVLSELWRGQVRRVETEGLDLILDLTGTGPPLGPAQDFIDGLGGEARQNVPLPTVRLNGARLTVLAPDEHIQLDFYGTLEPRDGGGIFTLAFDAASERLTANGTLHVELDGAAPVSGTLRVMGQTRAGDLAFELTADSSTLGAQTPTVNFNLAAEGDAAPSGAYLSLTKTFRPESGTFRFSAEGNSVLPRNGAFSLARLEGEADLKLSFAAVTVPAGGNWPAFLMGEWSGEAGGTLSLRQGTAQIGLAADVRNARATLELDIPDGTFVVSDAGGVQSIALTGFSVRATGIDTGYGVLRDIRLDGDLAGAPGAPGAPDTLSGAMRLRASLGALALANVTVESATIDAELTVEADAGTVRFDLRAPTAVNANGVLVPALLPIERVEGEVLSARVDLVRTPDGWRLDNTTRLRVDPLDFNLERLDAPPLPIHAVAGPLTVQLGYRPEGEMPFSVEAVIGTLEALDAGLVLSDSRLSIAGDALGDFDLSLSGGRLGHRADPAFFEPLTADFQVNGRGDRLDLAGTLRSSDNALAVDAIGRHDLVGGAGTMSLTMQPLIFGAEGISGAALSSRLADFEGLEGRVTAEAQLNWTIDGFNGTGAFNIENASFQNQGATVEGLNLSLAFDRLIPLHGLPAQSLTIRRIDVGVEATDLQARLTVDTTPDGLPVIFVDTMTVNVSGGRINIDGGVIYPTVADANLTLHVQGLELENLLRQLGVEDVSGEGQLTGTVPLRITGGRIAIEEGILDAETTGVIAFRSEEARQSLGGAGEQVSLMLDALSDFRFDIFHIVLNRPVEGELRIILRLVGNNPAVLEGYPFDITIALTGDMAPLLDAFFEGRRLSNRLLLRLTQPPP